MSRLMFVDCLLPASVHMLGGRMSYLAPRHAVRATVEDCQIRGGEYVAYDRANYQTALQAWLPEARNGSTKAQIYVGEIYEMGLGTTADYAQAVQWYQKAAAKGDTQGLEHLAYLYEQGLGVPRDPLMALNLYRKAAGLKDDKLTFQSQVDVANARIDTLTRQLDDRTDALKDLSNRLDNTQSALQDAKAALSKEREEANALRKRLERLKPQSGANLSTPEILSLRNQLAQREQHIAQQDSRILQLEQTSAQQDKDLTQRLAEIARQNSSLQQTLGGAQISAENARSQLAAGEATRAALEREISDLQAAQQRTESALQKAQSDMRAGSGASSAQASQLRGSLAAVQAELDRQKAETQKLATERDRLQGEIAQLQSTAKTAATAEQSATSLRAQIASMQAQLLAENHQITTLSGTIQRDQDQIESDRMKLADAASQSRTRDVELQRLNNTLTERETELGNERAQREGLTAKVKAERSQIDQLAAVLKTTKGSDVPAVPTQPPAPSPDQLPPGTLQQGHNYALIIGNATYLDKGYAELPAVERDVTALEASLRRYGFADHMIALPNASGTQIMNEVSQLAHRVGPADNILIYYSGHGEVSPATNATFWVPSNAQKGNEASWVPTVWVTEMIAEMKARHVLLVVDSCYAGAMVNSTNERLIVLDPKAEAERIHLLALLPSRTVLTSGGNEPVLSNGPGGDSIFARQLVDILDGNTRVLDASSLYDLLRDRMLQVSDSLPLSGTDSTIQHPKYAVLEHAGHLNGDFLFVPVGNVLRQRT
jgi:hypothetical protein